MGGVRDITESRLPVCFNYQSGGLSDMSALLNLANKLDSFVQYRK